MSSSNSYPNLIVVSAPSGAGKTTICKAILKKYPNIFFSVSYTTREKRRNEIHGKDYFFINKCDFEKGLSENKWAEWAKVYDNYYGTSAKFLDKKLFDNKIVILDIDVQGAKQIFDKYNNTTSIFILPPSIEALEERLLKRQSDKIDDIKKRLNEAKKEMQNKHLYKYVIINDDLFDAISKFEEILRKRVKL